MYGNVVHLEPRSQSSMTAVGRGLGTRLVCPINHQFFLMISCVSDTFSQ